MVSWAFAFVGVHRLSLPLLYLGVFPFSLLRLTLNFIRDSSLRQICLHPSVYPSLTQGFGEFPGFWIDSGTRCCGPRGGSEVRMKQKSRFKFLPWPGFEPRTLQTDGCERDH